MTTQPPPMPEPKLEPRTAAEVAAAFVYGMPDARSFPALPPSPAEVGDLILSTREHVQSLGWRNRDQLYTETQVRALLSEAVRRARVEALEEAARICDVTPPYPFRASIEAGHAIRSLRSREDTGGSDER